MFSNDSAFGLLFIPFGLIAIAGVVAVMFMFLVLPA